MFTEKLQQFDSWFLKRDLSGGRERIQKVNRDFYSIICHLRV
jgi:hypothetical protein